MNASIFYSPRCFCILLISCCVFYCQGLCLAEELRSEKSFAVVEDVNDKNGEDSNAIWDPIEGFNRAIFWFNGKIDRYFLKPIATVYDATVPDVLQVSVKNFFSNLRFPVNLLSHLAQLKFEKAGDDTARFFVNSTLGVVGLLDVAEDLEIEEDYQDFGATLGYWGIDSGMYIMLPILGPSCSRDSIGRIVDTLAHPSFYLSYLDLSQRETNAIMFSTRGLDLVQGRADLLEALEIGEEASFDYYSFVRSSYTQRRNALVRGKIGFEDESGLPPPGGE